MGICAAVRFSIGPRINPQTQSNCTCGIGTFDPVAQPPKIPKELMASDGNLWIVQCQQTVDQSVRDQLTRAGATLLRYVPDDAYIVRLTPETVETVRELESVRWIGPYHPAYRLDPSVVPEPFEAQMEATYRCALS